MTRQQGTYAVGVAADSAAAAAGQINEIVLMCCKGLLGIQAHQTYTYRDNLLTLQCTTQHSFDREPCCTAHQHMSYMACASIPLGLVRQPAVAP